MNEHQEQLNRRVLVLAPTGRDALLACRTIKQAELVAENCRDFADLCQKLNEGAGALLLTEEALPRPAIETLTKTLQAQPPWSDIPVVIFTSSTPQFTPDQAHNEELLMNLGNVTFLERPIRIDTLISTLRFVLRARSRQYQVRDLIEQQNKSIQHFNMLAHVASSLLVTSSSRSIVDDVFENLATRFDLDLYFHLSIHPVEGSWHLNAWKGLPRSVVRGLRDLHFKHLAPMVDSPGRLGSEIRAFTRVMIDRSNLIGASGVRALRIFPLIADEELNGVLVLGSRTREDFTSEEEGLLETVVNQVAVALKRRLTAEALETLNEELEQMVSQRTAALRESTEQMESFSYTVAHDLRAPLRAMHGFSEALLEDYGDRLDEEGKDYASRILTAAKRMDHLVQDLLDYSRLSRSEWAPEVVSLELCLQNALQQLQEEVIQRNARIQADPPFFNVLGNALVLQQAIVNLISNGTKFVAQGVDPEIRISCQRRFDTVRVTFKDNGIGIEKEYQERIFRVFERLHGRDEYPGTGIGLAMVAKAIQRMGGRFGVDSVPGKGSSFWIELTYTHETPSKQTVVDPLKEKVIDQL